MKRRINQPVLLLTSMLLVTPLSTVFGQNDSDYIANQQAQRGQVRMAMALTGVSITTADHLGIKLTVTMPAGGEVRFPSFGDRLGGFSVEEAIESYPMLLEDGFVIYEKRVMCRPLLPGDYTIPDITAAFTLLEGGSGEISVPGRIIEVTAAAPAGRDSPGLLDVLGLGRRGDAIPAFLLSVMVLLAVGVFILRKLKLKLNGVSQAGPPDPAGIAESEVDGLIRRYRSGEESGVNIYVLLSDILRAYSEFHYGFQVPGETTEDFLEDLSMADFIEPAHRQLLEAFLSRCDLVKFAGCLPLEEEIFGAAELLKNFIRMTSRAAEHPRKESGDEV